MIHFVITYQLEVDGEYLEKHVFAKDLKSAVTEFNSQLMGQKYILTSILPIETI